MRTHFILALVAASFLGEAKAEEFDAEAVAAICEEMPAREAAADQGCVLAKAIMADREARPTLVVEVERVVEKRVEVQATASVSTSQPAQVASAQPVMVNPMIGYDAAVGFGSMVQGGVCRSGDQLAWRFRNDSSGYAYLIYIDIRPVSWQAYGQVANALVVDQSKVVSNQPLFLPGMDTCAYLPAYPVKMRVVKFVKNPTMCTGPSWDQTCGYSVVLNERGQPDERTWTVNAAEGNPAGHHTYLGDMW